MTAIVKETATFTGARGRTHRSHVQTLAAAVRRAMARYRAWRQFRGTRDLLLQLDRRTLQDVVGLTPEQVQRMTGDAKDRELLGLK